MYNILFWIEILVLSDGLVPLHILGFLVYSYFEYWLLKQVAFISLNLICTLPRPDPWLDADYLRDRMYKVFLTAAEYNFWLCCFSAAQTSYILVILAMIMFIKKNKQKNCIFLIDIFQQILTTVCMIRIPSKRSAFYLVNYLLYVTCKIGFQLGIITDLVGAPHCCKTQI